MMDRFYQQDPHYNYTSATNAAWYDPYGTSSYCGQQYWNQSYRNPSYWNDWNQNVHQWDWTYWNDPYWRNAYWYGYDWNDPYRTYGYGPAHRDAGHWNGQYWDHRYWYYGYGNGQYRNEQTWRCPNCNYPFGSDGYRKDCYRPVSVKIDMEAEKQDAVVSQLDRLECGLMNAGTSTSPVLQCELEVIDETSEEHLDTVTCQRDSSVELLTEPVLDDMVEDAAESDDDGSTIKADEEPDEDSDDGSTIKADEEPDEDSDDGSTIKAEEEPEDVSDEESFEELDVGSEEDSDEESYEESYEGSDDGSEEDTDEDSEDEELHLCTYHVECETDVPDYDLMFRVMLQAPLQDHQADQQPGCVALVQKHLHFASDFCTEETDPVKFHWNDIECGMNSDPQPIGHAPPKELPQPAKNESSSKGWWARWFSWLWSR